MENTTEAINPAGNNSVTDPHWIATMLGAQIILLFYIESVIGYLWIICAILTRKSMWHIMNFFVVSLCCHELLWANLVVLPVIESYFYHQWTFGSTLCRLRQDLILVFGGILLWHVPLIAIHHYIVICHNKFYKKLSKKVCVSLFVVVVRLVPCSCTIPGVSVENAEYHPNILRCVFIYGAEQGPRLTLLTTVNIIIPSLITAALYIIVSLYGKDNKLTISELISRADVQITKAFGVIFIVMLLSTVPLGIVHQVEKSTERMHGDIYLIVSVIHLVGTSIYPLIFGSMCREIHDACLSCFCNTLSYFRQTTKRRISETEIDNSLLNHSSRQRT